MRRTLARIERLERWVAEAASIPAPVEKPPFTEEMEAEMHRLFMEFSATAPPMDEAARAAMERSCEETLRSIELAPPY